MHEAIYQRLLNVARNQTVVTYGDIAPLANLDMAIQDDRIEIGRLLGDISIFEHQQQRPLLSAVVIHRVNNMPGHGFFNVARGLGLDTGKDEFLFFVGELRRVHDYWRDH